MARLINTYQCEWATVVRDPIRRAEFRQFINTDENQSLIEFVDERGQNRPADWPKELPKTEESERIAAKNAPVEGKAWIKIARVDSFPEDAGDVIKYGDVQIAIFNSHNRTKWYATQNMCPHKRAFVLSQGIVGDDESGVLKVSCPMHKKNFALETGDCLTDGPDLKLMTFDVKIEGEHVWLLLPSTDELDGLLGTSKWMIKKHHVRKEKKINIIERVGQEVACGGCGDNKLDW